MADHVLFSRSTDDRFLAERLPDGSIAIFDSRTEAVHSLNPAAAAVLETCEEPAAVAHVAAVLEECTGGGAPAETALEVLGRLEAAELIVRAPAAPALVLPNRRELLKRAGTAVALALPVILTLTGAEQRLYAQAAGSGFTTTAAPETTASHG
jgi:hypothetical protein